jgi:hypothetical protein
MDDQYTGARHYAVLIGIDAYPDRYLKSCVRDVQKIKECLESKLSSVKIQILTASRDTDLEIDRSAKVTECEPTYRNVVSALERTTSLAQRGHFVYIHFSGHGTRLPPSFALSNSSTGDLALVLLKRDNSREEYLRGPRLAGLLNAMVDKGLVVTLVLDCCFSASVYRNGHPDVRYLPCNLAVAPTYPLDSGNSLTETDTPSTNRDASMRDNWLLEPDRYAILAACGPHESAKGGSEMSEKGEHYGALSYFLFKTLSDHGLGRRHKDIYRHLCARFWESCVPQHPVLYGNEDQGFFGPIELDLRSVRSICIVQREDRLQLLAGKAHGLRDGDRFAVFPPGSKKDLGAKGGCTAKVACVGPLTSELEVLETLCSLQTGWSAEPLACSYLTRFSIRLAPSLPLYDEWLIALKERLLGTHLDSNQVPALQVVLSKNDEYEVLDSSDRKIVNLPTLRRDETDANRICDVVEHLARFNMAKDLVNKMPTSAFLKSFHVRIISDGKAFDQGDQIEVGQDSVVTLTMENIGDTTLYVYVYNLGPCWQVKGIFGGTYEAIPARKVLRNGDVEFTGTSARKIKMTVPSVMHKYRSCEDIIKVFVTSQPTSFDSLELPNLDELVKTNAGDRIHPSGHVLEDWVALNFFIRTSL